MLDFRSIHLGESGIFRSATKREAKAFAKSKGWLASDVSEAGNRFCAFWIVCQCVGPDTLRVLKLDGATKDIPYPGRW